MNFVFETPYMHEDKVETYRTALESKIMVKPSEFTLKEAFERAWYPTSEKFLKSKLGRISLCDFAGSDSHICRVMKFERITSYQLENYFTQLT